MVQVMVNPGRRVRDKINQRDAVGGDVIEVRDVERKVLMQRGYVSDPPANDSQTASPVADEAQAQPEPAPEPAPELPVMTTRDMEPEGDAYSSVEADSPSGPSRRRYRRRDMVPE